MAVEASELSATEGDYFMEMALEGAAVIRLDREMLRTGLRAVTDRQLSALDYPRNVDRADGDSIVRVVASYVDVVRERHPGGLHDHDVAHKVGFFYALGLVRKLGWKKAVITDAGGAPIIGVTSVDRSLLALPTVLLHTLMSRPEHDNVIAAGPNLIAAGGVQAAPGELLRIL